MANTEIQPKIHNNNNLGQQNVETKPRYAYPPDKKDQEGKTLKDVRDQYAPNAEKPTTASGDIGAVDLPSVLKKVDPSSLSSVLPSMFSQLAMVNQTMNSTSQASRKSILEEAFYECLCILNKQFGFVAVIDAFNEVLLPDLSNVTPLYQSVVSNGLSMFISKAAQVGPPNIPIWVIPPIVYTTRPPTNIVTTVPDLYVKQYYTAATDPYPGYIQWVSPDGLTSVWTVRAADQPPYESAEEELLGNTILALVRDFSPYIPGATLTIDLLNSILADNDAYIYEQNLESNIGKGSSTDLASIGSALLGIAGQVINSMTSGQLPSSVLNQSSISSTLNRFSQEMAVIKRMKQMSASAITVKTPLDAISSVSSIVSSARFPTVAVSSVTSLLNKMGKS